METDLNSTNQSDKNNDSYISTHKFILIALLITIIIIISVLAYTTVNNRSAKTKTPINNSQIHKKSTSQVDINDSENHKEGTNLTTKSLNCTISDHEPKYIDKTKFNIAKTLKVTDETDITFLKVITDGRLDSIENIPYYDKETILDHHFDIDQEKNIIAYVYDGKAYIYNVKTKKLEEIPANNGKYTDIMFTNDKKNLLLTTAATVNKYNLQDNAFTEIINTTNVLRKHKTDSDVHKGYSYSYPTNSTNNEFLFFKKALWEGFENIVYNQKSKKETKIDVICEMYNCGTVLSWYKNKLLAKYELIDKSYVSDQPIPTGFYFINPKEPEKKEKIINYADNDTSITNGAEVLNDKLFFATITKIEGPYYTCDDKGTKVPVNVKYINLNAINLPSYQLLEIAKIPVTDTLSSLDDINNLEVNGTYEIYGKTYVIATAKHIDETESIYGIEPNYPFGIVEFVF